MKKVLWIVEVVIVVVLSLPLAILPLRVALKVGEALGVLLFYVWGSRRKIAIENLTRTVSAGAIQISEPAAVVIKKNFKKIT